MYKAPPPGGVERGVLRDRPDQGLQARASPSSRCRPCPITWAEHVAAQGHWGDVLREYMRDYVHWMSLGVLCEFLPLADNRVTLADETDRHGLPVARFDYSQCDNDRRPS